MGQADTTKATVLIVEDEAMIRLDLVDFFEDSGFAVLEADGADEAILLMEDIAAIAAVITDIQMPGSMDGIRLAHYVRDRHPPTLLILTSGAIRPATSELPSGALFMAKPMNPRDALSAIRAFGLKS